MAASASGQSVVPSMFLQIRSSSSVSAGRPSPCSIRLSTISDQWVCCRIHGVASEVDGTPAEGLTVWLLPADEVAFVKYFAAVERRDTLDRSATDAAGRFAFENVEPGAWWVGPAPRLGVGERFCVARSHLQSDAIYETTIRAREGHASEWIHALIAN